MPSRCYGVPGRSPKYTCSHSLLRRRSNVLQLLASRGLQLSPKLRILVVEDNISVATIMIDAMAEAGHSVVGHARTIEQGKKLLADVKCDAAILDVDLMGLNSGPLAAALRAKNIPFIVVSGSEHLLWEAHRGAPFVAKPFKLEAVVEAVAGLLPPKSKSNSKSG